MVFKKCYAKEKVYLHCLASNKNNDNMTPIFYLFLKLGAKNVFVNVFKDEDGKRTPLLSRTLNSANYIKTALLHVEYMILSLFTAAATCRLRFSGGDTLHLVSHMPDAE